MKKQNIITHVMLVILATSNLWTQSGGQFEIEKSVIAGGGGASSSGQFFLVGTISEPVAGRTSTGGTLELASGFWGGGAAPTAANVTVSGRVTTPLGLGLRNAVVAMIDPLGNRRIATTSSFGLYSFDTVPTGQTYVMTVSSKRYRFSPLMISVSGSLTNIDFSGLE